MKVTKLLSLAVAASLMIASCTTSKTSSSSKPKLIKTDKVVGAYFPDWRTDNDNIYHAGMIPAEKLTHVIYAFMTMCGPHKASTKEVQERVAETCADKEPFEAILYDEEAAIEMRFDPTASPDEPYYGHFRMMKELMKRNPNLTILPSFGGWTMSEPFHTMAVDPKHRATFVKSAVAMIEKYDFFGGIDLDWEYPGGGGLSGLGPKNEAAEVDAYTALITEFRAALDELSKKTGRKYELSAAIGIGAKAKRLNWAAIAPQMDHIFAMTYDFLGQWGVQTGHTSNLHATKRSIWGMGSDVFLNQMIEAGVPKEKLVLGAIAYGRGWEGTSLLMEDGSNEDYTGEAPPSNLVSIGTMKAGSDPAEPGYFGYKDLVEKYINKNGFTAYYDEESHAPYLWNPETEEFITYDNPRSVKAKAKYVKDQKLAGIFSWEISMDHNYELLEAALEGLEVSYQ